MAARPSRHLSPRVLAALTAAAIAVLVLGWFLRPPRVAQNTTASTPDDELAHLTQVTERRTVDSLSAFFSSLAGRIQESVFSLDEGGASALPLAPDAVITMPVPSGGRRQVTTPAGSITTTPVIQGRHFPFAVLRPESPGTRISVERAVEPAAGEWVVAVWRTRGVVSHGPGHFVGLSPIQCGAEPVTEALSTLPLNSDMTGGALFDLDGRAVAVIASCPPRVAALTIQSVDAIVRRSRSVEGRLVDANGIEVARPSEDEARDFQVTDGLIVRAVWNGSRGDRAGLRPGDVIVRAEGRVVTDLADLEPMIGDLAGRQISLIVKRQQNSVSLALQESLENAADANRSGIVLDAPLPTYEISRVLSGTAASAGLRDGDRIVRFNQLTPQDVVDLRRVLANARRPLFLEVERSGRRVAVVLR